MQDQEQIGEQNKKTKYKEEMLDRQNYYGYNHPTPYKALKHICKANHRSITYK